MIARYHALNAELALLRNARPAEMGPLELIAVSKTQPFEKIKALYQAGQRDFGENYVQELVEKSAAARARGMLDIRWHFIGHLQSNKVAALLAANPFAIHALDSIKLIRKLDENLNTQTRAPLRGFLQINIDGESTKGGIDWNEVDAFLDYPASEKLLLQGLMIIPDPNMHLQVADKFQRLYEKKIATPKIQWLSMGMSADYAIAAARGANYVRIGTQIFGVR